MDLLTPRQLAAHAPRSARPWARSRLFGGNSTPPALAKACRGKEDVAQGGRCWIKRVVAGLGNIYVVEALYLAAAIAAASRLDDRDAVRRRPRAGGGFPVWAAAIKKVLEKKRVASRLEGVSAVRQIPSLRPAPASACLERRAAPESMRARRNAGRPPRAITVRICQR